jgi:hypothetical protein
MNQAGPLIRFLQGRTWRRGRAAESDAIRRVGVRGLPAILSSFLAPESVVSHRTVPA